MAATFQKFRTLARVTQQQFYQYKKMELQLQMSLLTFVLLWTLSFLPVLKAQEELPDVQVKIIKEAKKCDLKAEVGDHLKVHYTGRFDDENGKIFDSSKDRGNLFSFQLGAGQVSMKIKLFIFEF